MGRDVGAVTFPQNPKMLITIRTESEEYIPETLICQMTPCICNGCHFFVLADDVLRVLVYLGGT